MNVLLALLVSLILTSLVSFAIPIVSCFSILGSLYLISRVDVIGLWGLSAYENTWQFFAIFGEGSPWIGILTIAFAAAFVGFIFESLNFYRYQILIDRHLSSSWQTEKIVELVSKVIYNPENHSQK